MGTYNNGVLGSFSGKVGPVVGSHWRGKNILRSKPSKITKAPSAAQQLQRDKFKFVFEFLSPMKGVLAETFATHGGKITPFNSATSYHLKEAVIMVDSGFAMDYSKVLIGMGGLCGMSGATVTGDGSTSLNLSWQDNSRQGLAYPTDELLVVAYAPALNAFDFFMSYSTRDMGACTLDVATDFHGETIHLWATFTNTDQSLTATSTYLGAFTV